MQGHGPLLISDLDCQYQIEWRTEYACPEKKLQQQNSCILTMENHEVEVDLSPLKRSRNRMYILRILSREKPNKLSI